MISFICAACHEYKLSNNLAFTFPVDDETHEGVCGDCADYLD
jgi:hypothetical protein